jgi:hypothetical protein
MESNNGKKVSLGFFPPKTAEKKNKTTKGERAMPSMWKIVKIFFFSE